MELDQLKLFVDLVRVQSFTKVAELNYITQPAVSLSIQKLEDELGVKLLERTTRKVLVTEEGRILHEYARDILEKVREVRSVLLERQDRMLGTLSLATVHSVGLHELPVYLKEYIRRYPEVSIHIDYRLADAVCHAVLEGEADLGIIAYPEEVRANLHLIPFFEDELVLICNREHPWFGRNSVPLSALDGQSFIAFEAELPTRRAIDQILREHNVSVEVRMQCDNIEILKKMVEVGLGVSLVPAFSVRDDLQRGSLASLEILDHKIKRPLGIVHRKGKALSRPQAAFVQLLTQEAATLLARDQDARERALAGSH
jgi:DNA-binding transcriptional LysR family regulator